MSSDNIFNAVEALIASDERQSLPEPVELARNAIAKITRRVTNPQSSSLRIGEAAHWEQRTDAQNCLV